MHLSLPRQCSAGGAWLSRRPAAQKREDHKPTCSEAMEEEGLKEEVLQVIEVELGSMVPAISNLRALPCPTAALWPQAVFDLDYGGLHQPSREI